MANLVFTCPTTKFKVQHWFEDDKDAPVDEYRSIVCQACTKVHFINRQTGQLLGQKDSPQAGGHRNEVAAKPIEDRYRGNIKRGAIMRDARAHVAAVEH